MVYERSGDAFQDYPRDNPLGAAPGRCAAEALPSFRTPKDTRAGKGTCNLLAPPPRGGSTPVSPLTVRPLGGVADACFVCESRGRWNLPNGPFPFGAHRDRVQAMLREYVRFNATKRERTRRNAMMCEDVRLIVDSRVDRERSHKFAVSFDGKICVVPVRASAHRPNTAPYSPAARRHRALRGAPSLPRQRTDGHDRRHQAWARNPTTRKQD